jgi:hypothetical protein
MTLPLESSEATASAEQQEHKQTRVHGNESRATTKSKQNSMEPPMAYIDVVQTAHTNRDTVTITHQERAVPTPWPGSHHFTTTTPILAKVQFHTSGIQAFEGEGDTFHKKNS